MGHSRVFFSVVAVLLLPLCCPAQQAPMRDAQGVALLGRSLAALVGATPVHDITLTGSVTRIAGSDDETGTGRLEAMVGGRGRLDLSLPSGARREVRGVSGDLAQGHWSGPDGAWHEMAMHNAQTDGSWFYPGFLMAQALSNPSFGVGYAGRDARDGVEVDHVIVWKQPALDRGAMIRRLSQTDFYLDPASGLPLATSFAIHPDNDAGVDIRAEIRFADYRSVNGVQVPFRIQKLVQGSLFLDIVISQAAINTGVQDADFAVSQGGHGL
jgi:hypothetical protein